MLSQTAEYALRAAVYLGKAADEPRTTREIAEATRVPPGYLAKVLQLLSRSELVRSQRGLHGGYVLARDAAAVSVLDVLDAVDPIRRINVCPLGLDHDGQALCSLHRRLDQALASVEHAFRHATIADMLADPAAAPPLCEDPACRSSGSVIRKASP